MIELIAYGDFNCPFSALASARLGELERRGVASGEWRAVEHDTRIPPAGLDVSGDLAGMLTSELDRIRDLLAPGEPDRLRLPVRQVSTALATRRYAGTPAGSRPAVRQGVFDAHWQRGGGIDDPAALDGLGAGRADPDLAGQWRAAWQAATEPIVPVLVLADGYVSRGLGALARLAKLLEG